MPAAIYDLFLTETLKQNRKKVLKPARKCNFCETTLIVCGERKTTTALHNHAREKHHAEYQALMDPEEAAAQENSRRKRARDIESQMASCQAVANASSLSPSRSLSSRAT